MNILRSLTMQGMLLLMLVIFLAVGAAAAQAMTPTERARYENEVRAVAYGTDFSKVFYFMEVQHCDHSASTFIIYPYRGKGRWVNNFSDEDEFWVKATKVFPHIKVWFRKDADNLMKIHKEQCPIEMEA